MVKNALSIPVPKKSMGQHWLDDEIALHSMVLAADVAVTDHVLEIGPGPGSLTRILVDSADSVTAVEFDHDLAVGLAKRVAATNLRVVESDVLRFDLTSLEPDYKVVANIPYYLTSKLIRILSETPNQPAKIALLVQKEVAERLAAPPGQLSILGVTAQYYFDISLGMVVPAALFTPPPKVDSQIVIMRRRSQPLEQLRARHSSLNNGDENDDETQVRFDVHEFFRVVKAGFGARRKTLLNALSGGLHLDKPQASALLQAAKIDGSLRAQNLSLADWYRVYTAYLDR